MLLNLRTNSTRTSIKLLVCLLSMVLSVSFLGHAHAQQRSQLLTEINLDAVSRDQVLYATFSDWYLKCNFQNEQQVKRCELTTLALKREDQVLPFTLKVVVTDKAKISLAYVETPLDLLIPKGAEFKIDKNKIGKLTFRSCHQRGCIMPFSMSKSINRRMLGGTKARFIFQDLKNRKLVTSFSLIGITQAITTAKRFLAN